MLYLRSVELFGLVIFSVIAVWLLDWIGALGALMVTVYIHDKRKTSK